MSTEQVLELTEYQKRPFQKERIQDSSGKFILENYGKYIEIDPPTFKTNYEWQLESKGYVGYIPITDSLHLYLKPKVSLYNLFRMWELAYKLEAFEIPPGLMQSESLRDFYEHLANILAKLVLNRGRKGFYRSYLQMSEQLPCIRGRMNLRKALQKPWDTKLLCNYEEHTPDVVENQILAWTMYRIAYSGLCSEDVLPVIRKAFHCLTGMIKLVPFNPNICIGRVYNRLNEDYKKLHALCLFFLEQSGPSHRIGEHIFLPFIVNMSLLYERFVAVWLEKNLPDEFELRSQEKIKIGAEGIISFKIDLIIYDRLSKIPKFVLDTKYKVPDEIENKDIWQVIGYSEVKHCNEAVLIYPAPVKKHLDNKFGDKRVRSLTFSLDGDLDEAGRTFLDELGNY